MSFLLAFCDSTIPVDFTGTGDLPYFLPKGPNGQRRRVYSVSTDDYDTDDAGSNGSEGDDNSGTKVAERLVFGQKYDDFGSKLESLRCRERSYVLNFLHAIFTFLI